MRAAFGRALMILANKDPHIVLLTPDVVQNMSEFIEKYPNRFFNTGLTEQATTSICSGLAQEGLRPILYSITPFVLERNFEQIKIDIDQMNQPVMIVAYSDYPTHGETHRPLNAPVLCSMFKNTISYFPRNGEETERAMIKAYLMKCPSIICLEKDGKHLI